MYVNHGKSPYNPLNITGVQVCYLVVTKYTKSNHTLSVWISTVVLIQPDTASCLQCRQLPPLPDSQFLWKASTLTLSQVNRLYDTTSKMSGVWEQISFYHHRHWGAFNLHLKNQQQMAVLWKTWNGSITCDKAKTNKEHCLTNKQWWRKEAMEFPNLFYSCLQLLCNLHTPLKTRSQFIAVTTYSLIVHYLLPVLLLIHDSPPPGHMFFPSMTWEPWILPKNLS